MQQTELLRVKTSDFLELAGTKDTPNEHEKILFERAQKYIRTIAGIHGIKMIAVCNSLSMYATHEESDIDLFIVTERGMIWYVRFWITARLFIQGVWRHGSDIAGNFCLSFFATTDAMDMDRIAIERDIYLYHWIYFLKPVVVYNDTYENFLRANDTVEVDTAQKTENLRYLIRSGTRKKTPWIYQQLNTIIRFFLKRKTLRNYHTL